MGRVTRDWAREIAIANEQTAQAAHQRTAQELLFIHLGYGSSAQAYQAQLAHLNQFELGQFPETSQQHMNQLAQRQQEWADWYYGQGRNRLH